MQKWGLSAKFELLVLSPGFNISALAYCLFKQKFRYSKPGCIAGDNSWIQVETEKLKCASFMKRIIKYISIIFLLSILWGVIVFFGTLNGWWHQPICKDGNTGPFVEAVEKELEKEFVGNFAMAIMKDGMPEKELFKSVSKKVDKNTVFQVSSMSKFVTAVGIMKLVELGKIDLDTPISKYLTRWQLPPSEFDNEQVTVRRLLSHTAGLTDELGYSGFENPDSVQTLEASLTKAADADAGVSGIVEVGMEPNSSWKYSGGGFTLLQLI